jgi:hypothetical protein
MIVTCHGSAYVGPWQAIPKGPSVVKLTSRTLGPALMFAAACYMSAGCGGDSGSAGATAGNPPAGSVAESDASDSAVAIDACALLAAEDISALLGGAVEGKSTTTDPELPGCIWENPTSYESVSVEIGNPKTAVNGTLPPPEPGFPEVGTPGPDGMRFLGNGLVEFAAGGRSNTVQVAVLSMAGDAANAAAVELARKIGPQLPD